MFYIKSKQKCWVKGVQEEKYFARVFRGANVSLDEIAKEISHATSISYPDVLAALKAFEIHVSNHVLNGNAVFFGPTLGAFIPALRSTGMPSADEVTAETVKKVTCRFFPSVAFKNNLKSATLEFKDLSKIPVVQ
jgi:predicted histone-like DNA-binding protein